MRRILSIDWDYFNDADLNTRMELFPRALDLDPIKSTVRWMQPYFDHQELLQIGIKRDQLERLTYYIKSDPFCDPIPVYIGCSHKYCYNFVKKFFNLEPEIEIVNIDYHDDIGDPNEKDLLAENWVTKLIFHRDTFGKKTSYKWCPDGMDYVNYTNFPDALKVPIIVDYEYCFNHYYDGIFVCRSDDWSPPHLDEAFNVFVNSLKDNPKTLVYMSDAISKSPNRIQLMNSFMMEPKNPGIEIFK